MNSWTSVSNASKRESRYMRYFVTAYVRVIVKNVFNTVLVMIRTLGFSIPLL